MTDNPLKGKGKSAAKMSAYYASEWARIARAKGLADHAKAWERADSEGWDETHFSQDMRDKLSDETKRFLAGVPR